MSFSDGTKLRLVDGRGSQVLPVPVEPGDRATVSGWHVHLTCDADMRTKHPEYAALAGMAVFVEAHRG